MKLPYSIRGDQRNVADVQVGQIDAENIPRLSLDVGPGGEAAIAAFQQMAGRDRLAIRPDNVFAHEDLLRGCRAVGLVLVDPGRRQVLRAGAVVSRAENPVRSSIDGDAGQRDVVLAALHVERIVRRQRHIDGAVAALGDEVEAVVEELAEDRHPAVEGRGQAVVGRDVGQVNGVAVHLDAILRELGVERRLGKGVGVRGCCPTAGAGMAFRMV